MSENQRLLHNMQWPHFFRESIVFEVRIIALLYKKGVNV